MNVIPIVFIKQFKLFYNFTMVNAAGIKQYSPRLFFKVV